MKGSVISFCLASLVLSCPGVYAQGGGMGSHNFTEYAPVERRFLHHYHGLGWKGFSRIYPNLYGDNLHNWEPERYRQLPRLHKVEYYDKTGWHVEERWW